MLINKLKNRKERKKNKKRKREFEKSWKNLINDEEKLFYDSHHFSVLEDAVNEKITHMNKKRLRIG